MVSDHISKSSGYSGNLVPLRIQLQWRLDALASLEQTGTPQAMKVLCLLLRELWARITNGTSSLSDQQTTTLQHFCTLIQKAMEKQKNLENFCGIEWCHHFCSPLWLLRESHGHGPAAYAVDFSKALEDLQLLHMAAEKILASRPRFTAEEAADHGSPAVPFGMVEGFDWQVIENVKLKEELQEMKSANHSLKQEVAQMEDRFKRLEQDTLRCMEVFDHQRKMLDELADVKTDNLKMLEELQELKSENEMMRQQEAEMADKLRTLEKEALTTQADLQELRLTHEGSTMEIECQKLVVEKDLLSIKKEFHELKLEYERLKLSESLRMKRLEDDTNNHQGTVLGYVTRSLNELSMECQRLQLNELAKPEVSDCCSEVSWVEVQQDAETSFVQISTLGFSVDTNGPGCFMLDSVFKTPNDTYVSGPEMCLGFNFKSKSTCKCGSG